MAYDTPQGGTRTWLPSPLDPLVVAPESMWPDVCCALIHPWFPLARIAVRLRLLAPTSALLVAQGLYAILLTSCISLIILGEARANQSTASKEDVSFGGLGLALLFLAISGLTLAVRREIRSRLSLPGSLLLDVCLSLWPCSSFVSIAAVDRQTAAAFPDALTGADKGPPRDAGLWRHPLYYIGAEEIPLWACSLVCPCYAQTRLLVLLGGRTYAASALALLALLLLSVAAGVATMGMVAGVVSGAVSAVVVLIALCLHLASCSVTCALRQRVRARSSLLGSREGDACASALCASCALVQMIAEVRANVDGVDASASGVSVARSNSGGIVGGTFISSFDVASQRPHRPLTGQLDSNPLLGSDEIA